MIFASRLRGWVEALCEVGLFNDAEQLRQLFDFDCVVHDAIDS